MPNKLRLSLFDLDHTLLQGDSDVLWCQHLIAAGVLNAAEFGARNAQMEADYRAGRASPQAFCGFYVATLAGRSATQWAGLRQAFDAQVIAPRLGAAAQALVQQRRDAGDTLVLTTATNRYLSELTARRLGMEHLIATECEIGADGRFTGAIAGTLNMREGKVTRLDAWLAQRGLQRRDCVIQAYSDSINDLPLLEAAEQAVTVNADVRLATLAAQRGWPMLQLWPAVDHT